MQIGKYIAIIVIAAAIGWASQTWLDGESEQPALGNQPKISSLPTTAEAKVENKPAVASLVDSSLEQGKKPTAEDITALMFIQNLSSMGEQEFMQFLHNSGNTRRVYSRELVFGVLEGLPTISDAKTWYRLVDFLNSVRMDDFGKQQHTIEDWVVNKIQSAEQQPHWLQVLSNFGVENINNIEFLTNNLDQFHDSESRVSALLALSRSMGLARPGGGQSLESGFSVSQLKDKIASYLSSSEELERAAAVSALGVFPTTNFEAQIATALKDSSERVRVSAMLAVGGQHKPNSETIKQSLLARMQATEASDMERLTAWQVLRLLPIEGKYYEAVHAFRNTEQQRLFQRSRNQPRRERTQWGY